nr:MAG TPA: hypothetical protein [Caudoviricetes sp.]
MIFIIINCKFRAKFTNKRFASYCGTIDLTIYKSFTIYITSIL